VDGTCGEKKLEQENTPPACQKNLLGFDIRNPIPDTMIPTID
jgi:hypothetical protein